MHARDRLIVSESGDALGMLVSLGCSLATSAFAFVSVGKGRSSFSHHYSLTDMVGGVFPATTSLEKATMRLSSAVLFA